MSGDTGPALFKFMPQRHKYSEGVNSEISKKQYRISLLDGPSKMVWKPTMVGDGKFSIYSCPTEGQWLGNYS